MRSLYNLALMRDLKGIVHFAASRQNKNGGIAPCGSASDKKRIPVTADPAGVTCLRCLRWLS